MKTRHPDRHDLRGHLPSLQSTGHVWHMSDVHESFKTALAGRYDVREVLGSGVTAAVYRADDVRHGHQVAVNVIMKVISMRPFATFLALCAACGTATEPGSLPGPITNEIIVRGATEPGVYAIDLDSLTKRLITRGSPRGSGYAISPDGRSIVFAAELATEDRGTQLYIMDSDGQNVRRVTGPPVLPLAGLDYRPSWAPNGTMIAFIRDHSLMVVNSDGSQERVLVDSISRLGRPSWSPDSRMILYPDDGTGGLEDLFTIDVQTGITTKLTDTPDQELYPDWSPAPHLVAYVGFDGTTSWPQVITLDLRTGERTPLTRLTNFPFPRFPKWSRSGRQIAFNLATDTPWVGEIVAVGSTGGILRQLAKDVRVDDATTWGLETAQAGGCCS